jgi:hypothetical protein
MTLVADPPANPLITPPTGQLTPVKNPTTKQPDYAFPLQTAAWLKMQTLVPTAIALPLSQDTFVSLYGTFSDEASVESALAVLGKIQGTAAKYGDPQTLISSLQSFQQASTAPESIYGHAVWLAAQTQLAAQEIGSLLQQGLTDIGNESNPTTRLAELKELLTGTGGVNSYATTLQGYTAAFETAVGKFYAELNAELAGLNSYLTQATNILTEALQAVTDDGDLITALNKSITALNKEYTDYVIAASLSPLFLWVPVAGIFLAVADAVTFTLLAEKVKKNLDDAKTALAGDEEDKLKKAALVAVLGNFNNAATDVETDGKAFLTTIGGMKSGWIEFGSQITARTAALTVEDVTNWSAFMQRLGFETSITGWNRIETKAEEFFQTGFVQFSTPSTI